MAKLYFRYGAMNSGKSTSLLQLAHNYEENGMNILLLKPSKDKKGENSVVSRLGIEREVDYLVGPNDSIIDIVSHHLETKRWAIKHAYNSVRTIIKIDQIIVAKPAGGPNLTNNPYAKASQNEAEEF